MLFLRCWCRSMDSREPSRRIPSAKHLYRSGSVVYTVGSVGMVKTRHGARGTRGTLGTRCSEFWLLWVIRPSQGDHGVPLSDFNEENPALLRAESLSTRAGHPSPFSHIFAAILDLSPTKATGNELSSWHGSRLPVSACPAGIPRLPCGSPRWNTHWLSRGGPQAWSAADLHRFV